MNRRCTKRVPFLSQMVYTRVREGVEPLGGVFPHKTWLMKRIGGTKECIVSVRPKANLLCQQRPDKLFH